jgi:hypothetical protein
MAVGLRWHGMPEPGQVLGQVDPAGDVVACVVADWAEGPQLWALVRRGVLGGAATIPFAHYILQDWLAWVPLAVALGVAWEVVCDRFRLSGRRQYLVTVTRSRVIWYRLRRWPWQRPRPTEVLSAPVSAVRVQINNRRIAGLLFLKFSFTEQHSWLAGHTLKVGLAQRRQATAVLDAIEAGTAAMSARAEYYRTAAITEVAVNDA